jgi:hypothetical protein
MTTLSYLKLIGMKIFTKHLNCLEFNKFHINIIIKEI